MKEQLVTGAMIRARFSFAMRYVIIQAKGTVLTMEYGS